MQSNNEIGALDKFISKDALLLIGRVLVSLIFIWSGIGKVMNFGGMSGYIGSLGLPVPELFTVIEIIIELGGGLALFFGVLFRLAVLGIIVHTILTALLVHHFWSVAADQALEQTIQFMKNVTIVGGLLFLNVQGPGAINLGRILDRK
ncbi:MAG TPA: DoxX family protein [Magnetospirillaceae bacterium]|jgi:putative oxidoreductase